MITCSICYPWLPLFQPKKGKKKNSSWGCICRWYLFSVWRVFYIICMALHYGHKIVYFSCMRQCFYNAHSKNKNNSKNLMMGFSACHICGIQSVIHLMNDAGFHAFLMQAFLFLLLINYCYDLRCYNESRFRKVHRIWNSARNSEACKHCFHI